ncbi:MAG: hypothetical protein AAGI53_15170 [Planctomycetota bacterium]
MGWTLLTPATLLASMALAFGALVTSDLGPDETVADSIPEPVTEPVTELATAQGSGDIETVDDLLARLEIARSEIGTLRADIVYTREFAIAGDTQTRIGRLYFDNRADDDDRRTRFAVRFNTLEVGDRREQQDQIFVFDGEWLVEKVSTDRRFTKRQVAPPGSTFDPLRIGQGPFPIPLGQKPEDIVERYNAELRPPTEGLEDTEGLSMYAERSLVQLRLTPKPEYQDTDDFAEIRLWYDPSIAATLPKIARTETELGDISLVVVTNAKLNESLPEPVFDTTTPPRSEGWNVTVSNYRQRVSTGQPGGAP